MREGKLTASMRERVKRWALGRFVFERLYERQFANHGQGSFRGVYRSFAEANRSAPGTKPLGFDNDLYAREFAERRDRIFSFDYPMLFWLAKLLPTVETVFDYGGHAGTHFYAYRRYLAYPANFRWLVCDLPAMTRVGVELAAREGAEALSFTNEFRDADGSDILIAAGSIQYIEQPSFAVQLRSLRRRPHHLLLNKLPLYDGAQFVTLQNGGVAFHPQYVFNRGQFVAGLEEQDYEVRDTWEVETHSGSIPFHPKESFRCHSGLYLVYSKRS